MGDEHLPLFVPSEDPQDNPSESLEGLIKISVGPVLSDLRPGLLDEYYADTTHPDIFFMFDPRYDEPPTKLLVTALAREAQNPASHGRKRRKKTYDAIIAHASEALVNGSAAVFFHNSYMEVERNGKVFSVRVPRLVVEATISEPYSLPKPLFEAFDIRKKAKTGLETLQMLQAVAVSEGVACCILTASYLNVSQRDFSFIFDPQTVEAIKKAFPKGSTIPDMSKHEDRAVLQGLRNTLLKSPETGVSVPVLYDAAYYKAVNMLEDHGFKTRNKAGKLLNALWQETNELPTTVMMVFSSAAEEVFRKSTEDMLKNPAFTRAILGKLVHIGSTKVVTGIMEPMW